MDSDLYSRVRWEEKKAMTDSPTHAGAVIYRLNRETLEFFLIGPRKLASEEWLLPKGHIERGESPEQTAKREVLEETGVMGDLDPAPLGETLFHLPNETVRTSFFLIRAEQTTTPHEARRMQWFPFDEAYHRLSFPDQRKILAEAARRLSSAHPPGAQPGA